MPPVVRALATKPRLETTPSCCIAMPIPCTPHALLQPSCELAKCAHGTTYGVRSSARNGDPSLRHVYTTVLAVTRPRVMNTILATTTASVIPFLGRNALVAMPAVT